MDFLMMETWSPYVVGVGIGILSSLAFVLSDKTIGCSTAFAQTAGMIERAFIGDRVNAKPYFQKVVPKVNWGFMLVIGVFIGSFLSAAISGDLQVSWVPRIWANTFGDSPVVRLVGAFAGGILMGFGSRWTGGCTSGHGISGTLQLAISSWIAVIMYLVGGIAAGMLIFS